MSLLKTFTFHGLEFTGDEKSKQVTGGCPFCGDETHFHVNPKTGGWDCKKCHREGWILENSKTKKPGFLEQFHAYALEAYADKDSRHTTLKQLAKLRRLPIDAFKAGGVIPSPLIENRYLIPTYDLAGKFANLHTYDLDPEDGKGETRSSPNCELQLFRGELLRTTPPEVPIYICEGHWDTLALEYLRGTVGKTGLVLGVPGANTFKKEWVSEFKGRIVYLLYDNDDAGEEGMDRASALLRPVTKELHRLHWWEGLKKGYDLNDFIADHATHAEKDPAHAWKTLLAACLEDAASKERSEKQKQLKAINFKTFLKKYHELFKTEGKLKQNREDGLALMLAVVISTKLHNDPLWMFFVGPPGIGKTVLLRCLEAYEGCYPLTKLTPSTLVSGYKGGEEDPSLFPQLRDKTLLIKDYTAIKSMPVQQQEEVYGDLRDAYDGCISKNFGNGQRRYGYPPEPPCFFTILAAVTNIIHGDNRATLGERFLKYIMRSPEDVSVQIRAALSGMDEMTKNEVAARDLALRFLSQKFDLEKLPKIPRWVETRIVALCQIVAYLRAGVHRDFRKDLTHRPEPEIGTRLAKQLIKLARCLAIVYAKRTVDEECYRIVEQVAFDTAYGWHNDVIRSMMEAPEERRGEICRWKRDDLAAAARMSADTLYRKLDDLYELGAIQRQQMKDTSSNGKAHRGQPAYTYWVAPTLRKLWKKARIKPRSHKPPTLKLLRKRKKSKFPRVTKSK